MNYDLYAVLQGDSQSAVDALVKGSHRGAEIRDIATRVRLLAGVAAQGPKDYAVSGERKKGGGYKSLVHADDPKRTLYAGHIAQMLKTFDLLNPPTLSLAGMPSGSWFLQFEFVLAKPYISKDDDLFYVSDSVNPVRKDKVFKVPMVAASSWKGVLRWTAMQTRLVEKKDQLNDPQFATERLRQTLLFGDEQGEEPMQTKGVAAYLDGLKPSAREIYEQRAKGHFELETGAKELPHHSGRLMCYPTFFDLIDVEVINPHSRKTKAGTHPIYLECVPPKAKGTFSLLYVPFDLIGRPEDEIHAQAKEDLHLIAQAVNAMMFTYGFSAKRTSGYGTALDAIKGVLRTKAGEEPLTRLSKLAEEVTNVKF